MSFSIGQQVGQYKITAEIGKGGMATVYRAEHISLRRDVAIKVMHIVYKEDETFLERFRREAQIVGQLDHPNIVPVYDYAAVGDQPYLVMKYVEGHTLKQRMRRQPPITLQETVTIMQAVADALDYAHARGILHRDVKPSNIMIDNEDKRPYLTDFGLARIASLGESTLSRDMMLGTPQYISPEQAQGNRQLDARTDVYSLGIVLYELIVGRVPFTGDTPYSIIHNHIFTPLPPPSEVNPTVPQAVQSVLVRALAKNPEERYPSAGMMIAAFRDAVERERLQELSASAYRPEIFEEHAQRSIAQASAMQQGLQQSPAIQGPQPAITPPPLSTDDSSGGMWVAQTGSRPRKRRWWNVWATAGCLLFFCACSAASAVIFRAVDAADRLAVSPVFDSSEIVDTVHDDGDPSLPNPDFRSMADFLDDMSMEQANEIIEDDPDSAMGLLALSMVEMEGGNAEAAAATLNRAFESADASPELIAEVARTLDEAGYSDLAVRLYINLVDLDAVDNAISDEATAYLYNRAASGRTQDWVLFCDLYEESSSQNPVRVLVGEAAIANTVILRNLRWPADCSADIQAPVTDLIVLDAENPPATVRLIQSDYYRKTFQLAEYARTLRDIILDTDAPDWVHDIAAERIQRVQEAAAPQ